MSRERLHPGTLSRERIVDVALDIAEREGAEGLSMRRIAAELDTGAMSLYNHVPDKAHLLEAMAERVLQQVEVPAGASWPDLTRAWGTSLRATLIRHRSIGLIVISANHARPLRSVSQALVTALVDAGLDVEQARRVMRVAGRFVAGSVVLDGAAVSFGVAEEDVLDELFAFGLDAIIIGLSASVDTDTDTD